MSPFLSSQSWGAGNMWFFGLGAIGILLSLLVLIIVIALKGYALWHAARRSEKWWFIALLIVNTMGILELVYLYFIVGKWHSFPPGNKPSSTTPPTDSNPTPVA